MPASVLHYLRPGLGIAIMHSHTHTPQQTHKTVTWCVEANKLLSLRRQLDYSEETNRQTDSMPDRQTELLTDELGSLIITCYGGSLLPPLCCHIIFATISKRTSEETDRQTSKTTQPWFTHHYLLWWQPPAFSLLSHHLRYYLQTSLWNKPAPLE